MSDDFEESASSSLTVENASTGDKLIRSPQTSAEVAHVASSCVRASLNQTTSQEKQRKKKTKGKTTVSAINKADARRVIFYRSSN